ncbi:penicillin-binding protein [Fulvivirga ligni]|uniref:penicillin-binding protein n=1 Tax=Fulvivirga ligni TaxID=2904246 RepID=UPI001F2BD20A|nr:penicillin-binding protein [Fulvivirga ligni]UII23236.1 transpeptidase family protein [Fulvivirga ligni]
MNIKKSILLRVRVAFLLVALFAIAIVVKTGLIQFAEGEKWTEMAEQINVKYKTVKATRGNIYSDNGSLLATSLPFYKLAFDATISNEEVFNQGVDSLAYLLSNFFRDESKDTYKRKLKNARAKNRQYLVLNRKMVGYQDKKKMSQWPIFRQGQMKGGVIFEKIDRRFHPFDNLSRRTIGFINENSRGAGLEYSFNEQLAGKDGEALYQKLAGGGEKPLFDSNDVKTENGYDIETTIDINLQDVTETALLRALEHHNADYGVVVVMEVATGEIKAISNLSKSKSGYYHERYNYAVGGLREPGSTFKLATMIALLEDTNISLSDSIDTGNGVLQFYKNTVKDHEQGGYGTITVQQAFEKSSNVAMAKLVDKHFGLDPDRFLSYIDHLGLSQPLGLQIKGEGIPKIKRPNDKSWSGITLPWMAYGYGLELTPIQSLALYNAVANDGKLIKPILVKKIRRADKVLEEYNTVVLNKKICSDETLEKLKIMLEGVVERGTAENINNSYYKIAGKTGTAQILDKGKYTKRYLTSFAGYFPADEPRYSAIVLIKNPQGYKQYGSSVAAPVFKEIADNIYSRDIDMHKPMPKEYIAEEDVFPVIKSGNYEELSLVCNELGIKNLRGNSVEDWVTTAAQGDSILWKDNSVSTKFVPNVKGMTLRDALYLLESCGLRVNIKGKGRVSKQSQYPGSKVLRGSTVTIELS